MPSPDTAFVGDTLETVGKFKRLVWLTFLRLPDEESYTNKKSPEAIAVSKVVSPFTSIANVEPVLADKDCHMDYLIELCESLKKKLTK